MSDGTKAFVTGKSEDDDLRALYTDKDGTMIRGGAGDDILRGSRYNDILIGGSGDDQMFGGVGADQFRFFGNELTGASDRDRIYDLTFGEGDVLVFGSFAAGTFSKLAGVNGFSGGTSAVISSYEGIVNAATFSDSVTALRASQFNDNLLLKVTNATTGQVQEILITGGWSQYVAAGGSDGL
jgi:Ca2+-binding RTX toxin-like protein